MIDNQQVKRKINILFSAQAEITVHGFLRKC